MFTDWTKSIFEESKLRPSEWLLVMGLWQLKLNATEIAAAADLQERTAQRCINVLDGGIYETYHLDPTRQLEHQGEADECDQSAGSKGLPREVERCERAPRQRGLQLRGRATAEAGRPPRLGLVQRRDKADPDAPAAQVSLEVLENVRTATIKPLMTAKVKAGAQFFTDEYNIYHFTEADYDHRTVNHSAGEYARRDHDGTCVHCNTMEGMWSGLRNFLDHFKGISQRFLHLRVARYEFLHNHGQLALAPGLRSSLAVPFLDPGRLFAADGPSTSPHTANALLPMSVIENATTDRSQPSSSRQLRDTTLLGPQIHFKRICDGVEALPRNWVECELSFSRQDL
jgi:transposase-like protein